MTSPFIQPLGMARNPRAAALLVERTFNEGRSDQYKRELVWNAVQAGAHNILATAIRLDGEGADEWGVKAAFVDDGCGMADTKIVDYIGELFNGASALGSDGNFQMGARVSTLPFNRAGIIVASWTEGDSEGTLLHIRYDEDSQTYGVEPQRVGEAWEATGVPPAYMRHPVIERAGHGTVFILLGGSLTDHTVGEITRDPRTGHFTYPTTRYTRDDWLYYNAKFWALPGDVKLSAMWAPADLNDWTAQIPPGCYYDQAEEGPRRFTYRSYVGVADRIARYAEASGTVSVTSVRGHRATVHWGLFPEKKFVRTTAAGGGASDETDYGIPLGLFGERMRDELYAVRGRGQTYAPMEHYGISRRELRDRLVLIVEPEPPSTSFIGATPSSARDRLLIANDGLPHDEWGAVFAEQMPEPIRARLRELNGENSKDAADRQRRLQDRLREFYGRPLRRSESGSTPVETGERPHSEPRATTRERGTDAGPARTRRPSSGHRTGFGDVPARDGDHRADQRRTHRPREITAVWDSTAFEVNPAMIAHYVEATRTLYLNDRHAVIAELIRAEQAGRQAKHDEIENLAHDTIADYLISMVLAAELYVTSALTGGQPVGPQFIKDAVSDHALTAACLNVSAVEHAIRQRFQGRPGFKRVESPAEGGAAA